MIATFQLSKEEVRDALMKYLVTTGMTEHDSALINTAQLEFDTSMASTEATATIRIDFDK